MSEYSLSQENLISSDDYDEVVRDLDGDGFLTAVQEDSTVFANESPESYNEDQKNFLPWNNGSHPYEVSNYESYPDQQGMMYPPMQAPVPLTIPQIPANVDYAGELDFDIVITTHTANRNSWIYSSQLNKVFINMQNILPVDIKRNPTNIDLYLRATLLYSLPQFAQELVERCSTHIDPRHVNNKDVDTSVLKHVLRCTNPGSAYMGDTDRKEHLSVVTPLAQPQAGTNSVRVNYQFMCKNSCPSGMNRRAVDVIFTLEDSRGNVLGRRKLSVRVCSCPKRDKEKEEKEYRDSLINMHQPTHGKKRKMNSAVPRPKVDTAGKEDNMMITLQFKVFGKGRAMTILKLARDCHAGDVAHEDLDEEKKLKLKEIANEIDMLHKKFDAE